MARTVERLWNHDVKWVGGGVDMLKRSVVSSDVEQSTAIDKMKGAGKPLVKALRQKERQEYE